MEETWMNKKDLQIKVIQSSSYTVYVELLASQIFGDLL